MAQKITEAEIVDVLLGGADRELESRVLEAIASDESLSQSYREWSESLRVIRRESLKAQDAISRVRRQVRIRLATETSSAKDGAPALGKRSALTSFLERKSTRRVFLAVAAGVLVCIGVGALMAYDRAFNTISIVYADGVVSARSTDNDEWRHVSDGHLRLPVQLRTTTKCSVHIKLPHGTMLRTELAPVELELRSREEAIQKSGEMMYTLANKEQYPEGFTVNIPEGRIVDRGTSFRVDVEQGRPTTVRVDAGSVEAISTSGVRKIVHVRQTATISDRDIEVVATRPTSGDLDKELLPREQTSSKSDALPASPEFNFKASGGKTSNGK